MRALVVYESLYGNTHTVAAAITAGLGETMEAEAVPVDGATRERMEDADLVVVGGPTHAHGMTSSTSREQTVAQEHKRELDADPAAHELDEAATGEGLRDWFHQLPDGKDRKAASFDTRFDKPRWLTGSAAHAIARRLRHHGFTLLDEPTSFFVEHTEGPLASGEAERARQWGEVLASRVEIGIEDPAR